MEYNTQLENLLDEINPDEWIDRFEFRDPYTTEHISTAVNTIGESTLPEIIAKETKRECLRNSTRKL